ncbi:MAG: DUF1848 domain-containing protein [Bacteroidaceae bacterium]|nr:DUF1848 domain-containing protein [Bacteroidaceae bacterium]
MATWPKQILSRDNGELVSMQVPEIISASRSTDIPAFYADWFFYRLKVGYSSWTNPFNGVKGYVSYKNTCFIVFWSKYPSPLLPHLDELKRRKIGCYIQYTLNDYDKEGLEKGVRSLKERIGSFKQLVDKLGYGSVIWRFDPLVLIDRIDINTLLEKIERIGDQLKGYTEKLVFSFADISLYRNVKTNLEKNGFKSREWMEDDMHKFANELAKLNQSWGFTLASCGERVDLKQYGIQHNHCIDDELIIKLAHQNKTLMDFLKVKIHPLPSSSIFGDSVPLPPNAIILSNNTYATHGDNKDKGQRAFCGCIKSKDIGEYNTCIHLCEYCYANTSKNAAVMNHNTFMKKPFSESITGR